MNHRELHPESATSLGPDEPMDDELCLFVLTLIRDGRAVHPRLAERARAWADAHPSCRRALGDFAVVDGLLASEPGCRASETFTERVLEARRRSAGGGDVLPLLRRLSVAAALLLGLTLAFDLRFPGGAAADDELARQPHVMDDLQPDPFAEPDLDAGLRLLLPDVSRLGQGASGVSGEGGR